MAYIPTTPADSSENPSVSQPKITENFEAISTLVQVNHVDFNDSDEGKHKFVTMPEQTVTPTMLANEASLYTKDDGTIPQLFWKNELAIAEVQFSDSSPNIVSAVKNDWDFVDGFKIRFGVVTHTGTSTPVVFSTVFPTTAHIVNITPIGSAGLITGWNAQSLSVSGFTLASSSSGGSGTFFYMAIGN